MNHLGDLLRRVGLFDGERQTHDEEESDQAGRNKNSYLNESLTFARSLAASAG